MKIQITFPKNLPHVRPQKIVPYRHKGQIKKIKKFLLLGTTLNSVLILLSSFSPKKGICNCITKTYNSSYKSREIFVACYSIHFSFSSNCKPTYLFSGIKQDFFCKAAVPPLFSLFDPHDVFLLLRMDFIVDLL